MSITDEHVNPFAAGTSTSPDCQGYHPIAVLADGELLCEHCVNDETNPIIDGTGGFETVDPSDAQWTVISWMASDTVVEGEGCAHCGRGWTS